MTRPTQTHGAPLSAAFALLAIASPSLLHAATMSASATPPAANGLDIANYGAVTGDDKWFAENNTGAGSAKGQTFTTGAVPALLKSITYQITSGQKAEPTKSYVVRLGTVSESAFAPKYSETASQTISWKAGEYMTWTLETPQPLKPNTTYAVDIGMTGSTTSWTTGIPYINLTANAYPGGQRYSTGSFGVATDTLSLVGASDRIFHLEIQHPLNPSPDIGSEVPAGDLILSWTNIAPTTGSEVWVDVWFGTEPNALTKVAALQQNLTSFQVNLPGADTYYWRIDSYLNGSPTGTPVQSTVFSFFVADSDSDGFPDEYELLHTNPPNGTALNREDDRDQDGLTNWVEFGQGTNPSDPDSDNDGLLDGNSITVTSADPRYATWAADGILFTASGGDRTFRGELVLGSNPLNPDSDGDGLSDGVETNSGTFAGASDTGTSPVNADTDGDGLKDGVETNTGTFVSASNTGTSPLNANTDGDNASDWYEVAASITSPVSASSKPNIPYPLPAYNGSAGVANKPVKVYIMSGQSNMLGYGTVAGTGPGTLNTLVNQENKFPNLRAAGGGWVTRNDVRVHSIVGNNSQSKQALSPTWRGTQFGPEFGFGTVMGWHHDEPVLLIKPSIGNRALGWDYLPPGSGNHIPTPPKEHTYAGYGLSGPGPGGEAERWLTATGGPVPFGWYAGKQFDDYFLDEEDMGMRAWAGGTAYPVACSVKHNGFAYISKSAHTSALDNAPQLDGEGKPVGSTFWNVYSINNTVDILDTFATEYAGPGKPFEGQDFEIAGYVWWQGHRDQGSDVNANRYRANMERFIKEIRHYYATRYPGKARLDTPFVLATIAFNGFGMSGNALTVANAQLAVDGTARNANGDLNYPEFAGNVKTIEARHYWRNFGPSGQDYHYHHNAETYLLTGDALGRAMVELQSSGTTPGDYGTWAATFPGADLTDPDGDLDGDGMTNNDERIFGLNPTRGTSPSPITVPLDATAGTFSYTRRDDALTGLDFAVWTSPDLEIWTKDETAVQTSSAPVNGIETVSVTLSPTLLSAPKLFVRIVATP